MNLGEWTEVRSAMNPISNFGRKVIIKGCLQSFDITREV